MKKIDYDLYWNIIMEWALDTDVIKKISVHNMRTLADRLKLTIEPILFAIDPGAIKMKCADRAEEYMANIFAKDLGFDDEGLRSAILGTEPAIVMQNIDPKAADCVQKNFSELIGTEPASKERKPE